MNTNKSRAFRITVASIETAIILSICWYVLESLIDNFDQLKIPEEGLNLYCLFFSFLLASLYLAGRGVVWHLMANKIIGPTAIHLNILVWLSSIMGKYLPGKVFLLLGRMHFYGRSGISKKRIGFCFIMEVCCSIIAASLTFLGSLCLWDEKSGIPMLQPILVAVFFLLIITHPSVFQHFISICCRIFKFYPVDLQLRWSSILLWITLMVFNWLVLGMGFYLLLLSVFPISFYLMPYLTGSFALAGCIGLLVVFAPAGIGVREAVMMTALIAVLPQGLAAGATIMARIWITLAEVLCSLSAILLLKTFFDTD